MTRAGAILLLVAITRTVGGATAALVPALAAGQITLAEKISNTGGPTTFDQPSSPLSGAHVVAAKASSNATVRVSHILSQGDPDADGRLKFSTWSLTASSPLNKNADDTDIATLDGLSNAASLEFSIRSFRARGEEKPVAINPQKRDEICTRVHEATKSINPAAVLRSACTRTQVKTYGSATDLHEFDTQHWEPDPKNSDWFWGLSAKVGHQNFEFIDAPTAAKAKEAEAPWSLGAFYSYKTKARDASWTPGIQYQRTYKEGTNGAVCPTGTGAAVTCATGPLGRPREITKKLISLEYRKALGNFGAGLTTTYDAEAKVWGFELPLHFVRDKDHKDLMAGFKLGWRDDTDSFTASVFVGSTFDLLKYY